MQSRRAALSIHDVRKCSIAAVSSGRNCWMPGQHAPPAGCSPTVPARTAFAVTQGEPRRWSRPTDSGNTLHCQFCPNCGSRVWHDSEPDDTVSIKGGTFDEPVDLTNAMHIWTTRKLRGVVIPEHVQQ